MTQPAAITLPLRLIVALAVVVLLLGLAMIHGAAAHAQAEEASISVLDCDSDPEVVTITNDGDEPLDLDGWSLASDPVASESFDLSALGEIAAGVSVNVQSGPSASGALVWSEDEVFRDGDPTDFARLLDGSGATVDEVACAEASETPTPTAAPTPTPADVPNGGGPPAPGSGPLTALVFAGAGVSAGAVALLAFSFAPLGALRGILRRQKEEATPEPLRAQRSVMSPSSLMIAGVMLALVLLLVAFAIGRRRS